MHNEEKSAAAERFIRNLKIKIYKHMTSLSKKSGYWYSRWCSEWTQWYIS